MEKILIGNRIFSLK